MIRKSDQYLLWSQSDLDKDRAAFYFANAPYGSIYILNEKRQVVGILTAGDVWRQMEREGLEYNTSFCYAESEADARKKVESHVNIHVIPVLDEEKRFCEQYSEDYKASAAFVNGILMKLSNYTGAYAGEVLRSHGIDEIRIMRTEDSDENLLRLLTETLSRDKFPVVVYDYVECMESRRKGEDVGILWVDGGGDHAAKAFRRYCWGKAGGESQASRFYSLKDLLVFLNLCRISYEGLERYACSLTKTYGRIAIYGHIERYKEVFRQGCSSDRMDDITDTVQLEYDWPSSTYRIQIPDTEEYEILVFLDLPLGGARAVVDLNGRYLYTDFYFFNTERYMLDYYMNHVFQKLEDRDVRTFFMQISDQRAVLKKAGVASFSGLPGNDLHCENRQNREDFERFLMYDSITSSGIYEELYGIVPQRRYMKNMVTGQLDYSVERNPTQAWDSNRRSIHIFGCCLINGVYVKDGDTIADIIKEKFPQWNVYSHGGLVEDLLEIIQFYGQFSSGDVIVIMPNVITNIDREFVMWEDGRYRDRVIDITGAYGKVTRVYDCIWQVPLHCNHLVVRQIAELVAESLERSEVDFSHSEKIGQEEFDLREQALRGKYVLRQVDGGGSLGEYLQGLQSYKREGCNGAAVMNCNPFTLGHRYLIECAAAQVDWLYVFVVEEDRSYFPFRDRFELVKEGCRDLGNVIVVPSGKYIISALTMPGYFEKENLQDAVLDASDDLEIFGGRIAPALNIKKRFAGTEQKDHYTAQYNEQMKVILPQYGIEFVVIDRKREGNQLISASTVRRLLEEENFEEIRKWVPQSTYKYLLQKYKGGFK